MQETTVRSSIDFEGEGTQHGFLKVPYSNDQSAWGCIMVPVTVIKNGMGPTALLTGGNHGDEYEGITALLKLAGRLQHESIQGRVIIVPAMNYPAVRNGTRTSPVDNGNMNRSFPGKPAGSVTERIADYFQRCLIPLCDYALDLHSGGRTLDILPFAASHRLDNKEQEVKCMEGARLFGAPATVLMHEIDPAGLYDTAVESQGKVFVTTELGGGGTSTPSTIAVAERGIANFLKFTGLMEGAPKLPDHSIGLTVSDASCYLQSEHHGVVEYAKVVGDPVKAGETLAHIHSIERTGIPAARYRAERDGILLVRRFQSLTSRGDTIAVIAETI